MHRVRVSFSVITSVVYVRCSSSSSDKSLVHLPTHLPLSSQDTPTRIQGLTESRVSVSGRAQTETALLPSKLIPQMQQRSGRNAQRRSPPLSLKAAYRQSTGWP
ncbi:hypothetical protein LX36DRAFT_463425 [Colletotrichum falcatum]|nr:hypothetical protein LX36DRAFT_463425 [Colletotrichum falcatum]